MGAWDLGSFDNDAALDWLADLEGAADLTPLAAALSAHTTDEAAEWFDMDSGAAVLAACEVVAALLGRPGDNLPQTVTEWVAANCDLDAASLVPGAGPAIDRVLAPNSGLASVWDESAELGAQWREQVAALRQRVINE